MNPLGFCIAAIVFASACALPIPGGLGFRDKIWGDDRTLPDERDGAVRLDEPVYPTFSWGDDKDFLTEFVQATGCAMRPTICSEEEWVVGYNAIRYFAQVTGESGNFSTNLLQADAQYSDEVCISVMLDNLCQGSIHSCAYVPNYLARLQKESDDQAKEIAKASSARAEIGEKMATMTQLSALIINNLRSLVSYIDTRKVEDMVAGNAMGSGRHAMERVNDLVERFTQTADSLVARYIAMSGATHPYTVHMGGREMLGLIDTFVHAKLGGSEWPPTMVSFFDHDAFLSKTAEQVGGIKVKTINPHRCKCIQGNRSNCVETPEGDLEMLHWYRITESGMDRDGCIAVGGSLPAGAVEIPSTISYVVGGGDLKPYRVADISKWNLVSEPGTQMTPAEVAQASMAIGAGNYQGNVIWWSPINVTIDPTPYYKSKEYKLPPCTWGWDENGRPSPTCIYPIIKPLKKFQGYLVDENGSAWSMGELNSCKDPYRSNPSVGSYGITPQKFLVNGVMQDVSSLAERMAIESKNVTINFESIKTATDYMSSNILQNSFLMKSVERGTNSSLNSLASSLKDLAKENNALQEEIKKATETERNNSMRLHQIADEQAERTKKEAYNAARLDHVQRSIQSPPSLIPLYAWCGSLSAAIMASAFFTYTETLKGRIGSPNASVAATCSGGVCEIPLWLKISGYATWASIIAYVALGVALAVFALPYVDKIKGLTKDVESLMKSVGFK